MEAGALFVTSKALIGSKCSTSLMSKLASPLVLLCWHQTWFCVSGEQITWPFICAASGTEKFARRLLRRQDLQYSGRAPVRP